MDGIRVLIADDHAVLRLGLRALLAAAPELRLVAEATTGEEVQRLCVRLQPDVLLLDLSMPGPPARDTLRFVRAQSPTTRVVVLSAFCDESTVRELVTLGVDGYVLKDDASDAVVRAVRTVTKGDPWFSRSVMNALAGVELRPEQNGDGPDLTDREWELLRMLAQGWDNARIAEMLGLRPQTVRNYLTRLFAKLGVSSRTEAVAWFHQAGRA